MDPVIQLLVSRYGMTPESAAAYVQQLRGGVQGQGTLIDRFDREALNDIVVPQTMQQMREVGPAAWMGYWKQMQKGESQRKHDMAKMRFAEQDKGTAIINQGMQDHEQRVKSEAHAAKSDPLAKPTKSSAVNIPLKPAQKKSGY